MGVTSSATLFIGITVRHEDFWTEQEITEDRTLCDNGHEPAIPGAAFCSKCGTPFVRGRVEKVLECTPGLKALAGDSDPEGRAGETWNPDPSAHIEERAAHQAFGKDVVLRCVDSKFNSWRAGAPNLALGFVVHEVNDISGPRDGDDPLPVPLGRLAALADVLRELADKLGVSREPEVFLTTSAG